MGNAGVVSPWSIIPQSMPGLWKSIPGLMFGYGRPLSIHPAVALRMIPWGLRFLKAGQADRVRATADAMSFLCGPSIDLYRRHLHGTGHEDLICDSLYVHAFRNERQADVKSLGYRIRTEKGAEIEHVGQDDLQRLEPALSPAFKAALLIKGQARVRSPGRLGTVLAEKARAEGVRMTRATIRKIRKHAEGWQVLTDGREVSARRIVIAMGAWSPDLLKETGLQLPLMAERGYHTGFPDPGIEINNSVMDADAKFIASSMEDGVRVAGHAEFAPVDAPPDPRRQTRLTRLAQAAFPDLQTRGASFWMGRRPSFPDSLPVLGEAPGTKGLFLNFGHSHYGLMMAPKSGDVLAQLICGEYPNQDLGPFAATRFA